MLKLSNLQALLNTYALMFSLTTHLGAYIEHQLKEVWATSSRVQALDDGSKNH